MILTRFLWLLALALAASALLLVVSMPARSQVLAQIPTPMKPVKRMPYVPAEVPDAPAQPLPAPSSQERPSDLRSPAEPPALRYVRLPYGVVACSLDPQGQQVCGNGAWLAQ